MFDDLYIGILEIFAEHRPGVDHGDHVLVHPLPERDPFEWRRAAAHKREVNRDLRRKRATPRPFKCERCGRGYITPDGLRLHSKGALGFAHCETLEEKLQRLGRA